MKLLKSQIEELINDTYLSHDGKDLYGICPWCKSDTKEFGISLSDNHPFSCFRKKACGVTGNIYTLLKYLGRAKDFLTERQINIFEKLESNFDLNVDIPVSLDLQEISTPLLWKRVYEDDYLKSRGFTNDQFLKFEVGRSKQKKDYVTFLVRHNGKLVGYISRSEKSKKWIDDYNKKQKELNTGLLYLRYENSYTDFSKTLFGIDEIIKGKTTDVILVEGIFSKTKTDVNLYLDYQEEIKCCATFGAKLSIEQIELLKEKNIKNVWLWFEADVLDKIKDIAAHAALFFKVRVSYLNGKDPNDIDENEALELLDNAKDWLDFNTSYIKSNLKNEI